MCTRLRKELDEDSKGKWTAEGQGISGGPRQFDVHMSQVCADDRALAVIVAAHIEGEPAEGPPANVAVCALNVLAGVRSEALDRIPQDVHRMRTSGVYNRQSTAVSALG